MGIFDVNMRVARDNISRQKNNRRQELWCEIFRTRTQLSCYPQKRSQEIKFILQFDFRNAEILIITVQLVHDLTSRACAQHA